MKEGKVLFSIIIGLLGLDLRLTALRDDSVSRDMT
jgi:hypothetical protein